MYNSVPIIYANEKTYKPISQTGIEDTEARPWTSTDNLSSPGKDTIEQYLEQRHKPTIWQKYSSPILGLTAIILLIITIYQQTILYKYHHPKDHYIISPYRTVLRQFGLDTPYKSLNHTVSAEAWDRISSGHGDVSIDPSWAAARGLPPSMQHPYQHGKQVYQIEAYHAMHCLKSLRNHFMTMRLPDASSVHASLASDPETWDLEHEMHCFDELRQHIQCNADDGLMYSEGHRDIGWQQYRLCRDWDQLSSWAADNSACWKDHINPSPQGDLWWHQCDDGDGLVGTGEVGL